LFTQDLRNLRQQGAAVSEFSTVLNLPFTLLYFTAPFRFISIKDASKSAANLSETAVSNIYTNRNNIPEFNQIGIEH
jgi:hypothetical protein